MLRPLLVLLLILTALRLWFIGQTELSPDEAYYTLWSQRLDLAYYSKGPGVALAIRAGVALFGETSFGVRFLSPLLALGTSLLLYGWGRRLVGPAPAAWAVLAINLIPIFTLGSVVLTIDPLSIFFWAAALWAFWEALRHPGPAHWAWPLAGLCLGLGFLCKYTAALQLLSIALLLLLHPAARPRLRTPGPWLLLAAFLACTWPPILWNIRHGWITATHLRERGKLDSASHFAFHPKEFLEFFTAHFGAYSPLLFLAILLALPPLISQALRRRTDPRPVGSVNSIHPFTYAFAFALPLLLLYTALALNDAGEANWTAPAFVGLALPVAAHWLPLARRSLATRRFLLSGLALSALLSVLLLNTETLRLLLPIRWPYATDPSARLRGWQTASDEIARLATQATAETGAPPLLIANKYQVAAAVAFDLPSSLRQNSALPPLPAAPGRPVPHPAPAVFMQQSDPPGLIANQFSLWPGYADNPSATGRPALYLTDRADRDSVPAVIANHFAEVRPYAFFQVTRRGQPLREIRVFLCLRYHP